MKKAVIAKVAGVKNATNISSRKLPESIKNAISFDVIQLKSFKISLERLPSVVIRCVFQWQIIQTLGFFQRPKGRGRENFPVSKPSDPHFCSHRSHLVSAPPQYECRSRRACEEIKIFPSLPQFCLTLHYACYSFV